VSESFPVAKPQHARPASVDAANMPVQPSRRDDTGGTLQTAALVTAGVVAGATLAVLLRRISHNRAQGHSRPSAASSALPSRLQKCSRLVVQSVDCHCEGLPARVVIGGAPRMQEEQISSCRERREAFMQEHDSFRRIMLQEPRGYPCQNVDIIFPPTKAEPSAAFSYIIGENAKVYPSMSGHNTICVATALLETGLVPMQEPRTEFVLEAPIGPISISAVCKGGKALSVTFTNRPAFVATLAAKIPVPHISLEVEVDIAFGGMWYAIVDLESEHNMKIKAFDAIRGLQASAAGHIVRLGEMIKVATRENHPVQHPDMNYPGPDILAFRCTPATGSDCHGRNAVVMSTGELDWDEPSTWKGNIDRSPCGGGTSAVMAMLHARGKLGLNEPFRHESILGTVFEGRLVAEASVGRGIPAVVPTITGSAWITQMTTVVLDPTDPFPEGYTLGDIWAS